VSLTHRPYLSPGVSWYSFLEAESTPGHMVSLVATKKFPATRMGSDPETLRLVVQCLNHYATPGPIYSCKDTLISQSTNICVTHSCTGTSVYVS
jgi:hypothetical protein